MPTDPRYFDDYDPRSLDGGRSRRARIITWAVTIIALAGFGTVIWYAYNLGIRDGTESVAPLIRADARPTKIKPEQPGGMAVPHQDKEIYDTIGSGGSSEPKVERLLSPAEQPKTLPTPAPETPASPAPAPPASSGESGAPTPSQELQALMEREGLVPKTGAAEEKPAPSKAEVATAPPPPPPPAAKPQTGTASPPAAQTAQAPAQAAAPPPPPKVSATADLSGRWRIQLAAFRDRPTAESEWRRLQARYPDLLGALALEVQKADLGAKGIFYRMRGGPLADEASAKLLCAQLKQRNQGCMIVRP